MGHLSVLFFQNKRDIKKNGIENNRKRLRLGMAVKPRAQKRQDPGRGSRIPKYGKR